VSSMQLTISLSATDQATAGSYAVVVTNPAPGGVASSPLNFAVGNPQPSLSSLSPASAVAGAVAIWWRKRLALVRARLRLDQVLC